jgi:hypothetical protein
MHAAPVSRLLKVLSGVLALLLLAELSARVLEDRLPEPLVWHTPEAQYKVHQMDRLSARGGAQIVLLGTSQVISGLNPEIIDAAIGGRSQVYNAALASGVPRLMDPWTTDVVIPRLHPKVLIIGVSSYDFKDDERDLRFIDGFLGSPAGLRATGRAGVDDDVDWWLRQHVVLWNERFSLRDPQTVLDAVRGEPLPVDPELQRMSEYGWLDLKNEFVPNLRINVTDWAIGTRNVSALTHLLETARSDGITTVLVNMPVTQEYVDFHPHGEADYAAFGASLARLADQTGAVLLDFDSIRDHQYYADLVHLDSSGATLLTNDVVAELGKQHVLPGQ